MNGKQNIVAAAGVGLLAVNFWTDGSKEIVATGLFNNSASSSQQAAAHKTLVSFGATLLVLGAGVILAGASDSAGTALIAVLAALFLLWAITHYSGGKTVAFPSQVQPAPAAKSKSGAQPA